MIERLLKLKGCAEGFGVEMTSGYPNNQVGQLLITSWSTGSLEEGEID